jgi:hypothetical protein
MNGYLKINLLPQLNFKSNIFYERASLDDFRYTHNKYGAASSVQGRVSQDRDFIYGFVLNDGFHDRTNTINFLSFFHERNLEITQQKS